MSTRVSPELREEIRRQLTDEGFPDPDAVKVMAREDLRGADQDGRPRARSLPLELDAFLNAPEPEYVWLVEGLVERADRVMLTAPEGAGKSTLFRQVAQQLAAGIHPFTLEAIAPLRVFLLDLENPERLVRRSLRALRIQAGDAYQPGQMHLQVQPQGMDLYGHAPDRDWLEEQIRVARPDVVLAGPLYKMAAGDPNEEKIAKAVQVALDDLRVRYDFVLFLEAHTGHGSNGAGRPTRPIGSSAWLRWPEFGLHLAQSGTLSHWRGPRDEREWPSMLKRGGTWPWTPEENPREELWARIRGWVDQYGRTASIRKLAEELGVDRNRIDRALKAHQGEWADMVKAFGEAG